MKKSNAERIRQLLTKHEDGLTAKAVAANLGVDTSSAYKAMVAMPDVYIDRWDGPFRGRYAAVWCAVKVPENCPKPN
jgi:hypothetical protein